MRSLGRGTPLLPVQLPHPSTLPMAGWPKIAILKSAKCNSVQQEEKSHRFAKQGKVRNGTVEKNVVMGTKDKNFKVFFYFLE